MIDMSMNMNMAMSPKSLFNKSSLPLTMEVANLLKILIIPELDKGDELLPYSDRIVAWLLPSMKRDIILFHAGRGKDINSIFGEDAIKHIDQELLAKLLEVMAKIYPKIINDFKNNLGKPL